MSEHHSHHRHHRRGSAVTTFLRANRVEIIAAALVALGFFLLLERMSIRATFLRWATIGARDALHVLGHADNAVADLIARLTLSNAIGIVLILVAVIAVVLRLRWRLMRSASLTALRCPRCGGDIRRVHRRLGDRVVSWFVPVRRYRCSNKECGWDGIRVSASKHGSESPVSAK